MEFIMSIKFVSVNGGVLNLQIESQNLKEYSYIRRLMDLEKWEWFLEKL